MKVMGFHLVGLIVTCVCASVSAHDYIISSDLLHNKILPTIGLGDGRKAIVPSGSTNRLSPTDLNGELIKDDWENKEIFEGFALAKSLFHGLKVKYPSSTNLKTKKLLFVGGFEASALRGWFAAAILSAYGIQCDLYVIQEEGGAIELTPTRKRAKEFLKLMYNNIGGFSNVNFVHFNQVDSNLDSLYPKLKECKEELARASQGKWSEIFLKVKDWEENEKHQSFLLEDVKNYDFVVNGSVEDPCYGNFENFKIGLYWVLKIFDAATKVPTQTREGKESTKNILVSIDFPGVWKWDINFIPKIYQELGNIASMPAVLIHIGAMKPFVLNEACQAILNLVAIPEVLEIELTGTKSLFKQYPAALKIGPHTGIQKMSKSKSCSYAKGEVYFTDYTNIVAELDAFTVLRVKSAHKVNRFGVLAEYLT